MKKIFFPFLLGIILLGVITASAQDDLEAMLNNQTGEATSYATATFKNTRVLNGHSVEMVRPNELEFRISHRFGEINSGAYNLWGLDNAHIHFSLEYGINDWLNVGIGRGTYQKTFDGFVKARLLRQSSGDKNVPVSLTIMSSVAVNSLKEQALQDYFSNRLSYVTGVMIARKFTNRLSLQLAPHYVHRNFVEAATDLNDLFAMGFGGRYKLTNRVSLNFEYFYIAKPIGYQPSTVYYNPLSIGVDIETGGHVFQIHITNSLAMIEKGFIGETTGNWLDGGIHIGFNISRVFTL